jgi:hypothetical protein
LAAILVLGASAAASAAEPCLAGAMEVRATAIADPRSLMLADGRVLRLAGIESFALLAADADAAEAALADRLAALLDGASLSARLLSEDADRYGRFPALVAHGTELLQEIVAHEGLAIAYAAGDTLPCFDRILSAEEEARRARRGFWTGEPLPEARPEALGSHIGRFAIFEGMVVSVGNRRNRTYLNFGRHWSTDVTAVIEAADREQFGGEAALAALTGRRVRIRGFLEESGGPMVMLRSPLQMQPIEANGVSP